MTWLVLDCPFLCHRVSAIPGGLSIAEGFFHSLSFLWDRFQPDRVAFCWDHHHLFRRDLFPAYKLKKPLSEEDQQKATLYHDQSRALRSLHLPELGFANIFRTYGLEADDWMAWLAITAENHNVEVVIVTSDADLYQCLSHGVMIYNPNKPKHLFTRKWFRKEYGISPRKWSMVKAIGGCSSDRVPGLRGVGEVTALRFLRKELDKKSKMHRRIERAVEGPKVHKFLQLVKLPWEMHWKVEDLKPDKLNKQTLRKWDLRGLA